MTVLVTCKFEKDLIKNNREKVEKPLLPVEGQPGSLMQVNSSFRLKRISLVTVKTLILQLLLLHTVLL